LGDTGLESVHGSGNYAVDEKTSGGLITRKGLIVVVTLELHHLIDKSLVGEGRHREDLIEISGPNRISVFVSMTTIKFDRIFIHQNGHVIDYLLVRLSLFLDDSRVIHTFRLFNLC